MDPAGFFGKTVIVTGHTGFKGSWLSAWLTVLGARVIGISLPPPQNSNHFEVLGSNSLYSESIVSHFVDIRDRDKMRAIFQASEPDFVFHLAAQPIVRISFEDPASTYDTNFLGTLNVLEALRCVKKSCIAVLITSDKSYRNKEWDWGYRESDELGGDDPYSASKAATELLIRSHVKTYFPIDGLVRVGVGRAGNVIGGGDWAISRIIPDCVRGWADGKSVRIRNPNATRPWQHVLEPLGGYLSLASSLGNSSEEHGEAFNFGPSHLNNHSVREVVSRLSDHLSGFLWNEDTEDTSKIKESKLLKLSSDKALSRLKWHASLSFSDTIKYTAEWYEAFYKDPKVACQMTFSQIHSYSKNM